jgi:hypothetical protein
MYDSSSQFSQQSIMHGNKLAEGRWLVETTLELPQDLS